MPKEILTFFGIFFALARMLIRQFIQNSNPDYVKLLKEFQANYAFISKVKFLDDYDFLEVKANFWMNEFSHMLNVEQIVNEHGLGFTDLPVTSLYIVENHGTLAVLTIDQPIENIANLEILLNLIKINFVVDTALLKNACKRFISKYNQPDYGQNFHVLYASLDDMQKLTLDQFVIDSLLTEEFSETQIEYIEGIIDINKHFNLPQKHKNLVEKIFHKCNELVNPGQSSGGGH